ncbi:hypothetical protein LCGC14_2776550 [marine sediment metagenome]|uniref:Uncharacterized protein n=1 Tax=marine sediment metagenome TaxID=412755 RepID=A0A0F8ZGI0_9ZZZZ
MEARAVLTKYGTAFLPLFNEIDSVVKNAVKEGIALKEVFKTIFA